jgi:hypothetical protein
LRGSGGELRAGFTARSEQGHGTAGAGSGRPACDPGRRSGKWRKKRGVLGRFGDEKGPFGPKNRRILTKFDHGFEVVLLIMNGLCVISVPNQVLFLFNSFRRVAIVHSAPGTFGVRKGRFEAEKGPFDAQNRRNLTKFDHVFWIVLLILMVVRAKKVRLRVRIFSLINCQPSPCPRCR